ncbi:MAG TPA: hypothetical protein VGG44_09205 [Tepidisphaeraceae bacterium]
MKKRLIRIAMLSGGGLVLLAIAVSVIVWRMGSGTIQDWIGSQVQGIANSYLNPKLSFTDLAYEYPLTVSLKNLHLTADDPAHAGHTIDIIACQQATLSLAQIPTIGKPIVIQKIILDQPLISAVAVQPGSKDFVGFSDLIRGASSGSADQSTSSTPKKLSDVFQMRLVQINDGKIVYDPRIAGTVPMSLDQINTVLNIEPTDAGWYKLDTTIARKPVFNLQLAGQLNLDSFSVRDVDIKLLADLGQDKLDYLPPELQSLLKQYEARGKLSVEVTGSMPLMDPMKGQIETTLKLDGANLAMGGLRVPVDNLDLDARFADGKATLPSLKIVALGGSADLSGSATLNERLDADLHLKVAGMVLEKLFANQAMASGSSARLDLDFNVAGSLKSIVGQAPAKPGEPLAAIGIKDFRISADDPVNPGQKLDVVACKSLDVAMTEPIISGKPIVIDKIILDEPAISAVAVEPGSSRFVGVPNLPPSAPSTGPSAPMPKIGNLIQVKTFELNDAKIVYDPRIPGTQRMHLEGISTSLHLDPKHPGSYLVDTKIASEPVFSLGIDGEINIDDPGLQNLNMDLQADLTQDRLDFLPPQLQLILKQTHARGKLSVKAAASVALSDLARGKADVNVDVRNIQLSAGNTQIPVEDFALSARLRDGKVQQSVKITALNSEFDLSGWVMLNNRFDTDTTLTLKNLEIEPLLAALRPSEPAATSSTKVTAAIEVQSPIMVALGAVRGTANEPVATVNVRNLRLTTDDPTAPGSPLDFVACDRFGVVLNSLPKPGSPITVDQIVVEHPAIRAVAMAPQSKEFAGFASLQKLVKSHAAPAENPDAPSPPTEAPGFPKLSEIFRLGSLSVADGSLYYDPRIDGTTPFSVKGVTTKIAMDSMAGDAYRFDIILPSKPVWNIELAGRINVDSLIVDPLKLDLSAQISGEARKAYPPEVQKLILPYEPVGKIAVKVEGKVPLLTPMDSDVEADLLVDDFAATTGNYRIPIDHVRLPIHLKDREVEFENASNKLGGSMLEALSGHADLMGKVKLNDHLDSTLSLITDGMLLQDLMADKIADPKKQLIGALHADVELVNAPVLVVVAKATSRPSESSGEISPLASEPLPVVWGSADIELTHARLVGFELIQGMGNIAKSVFTDLFHREDKDKPEVVVPKETAQVECTFNRNKIWISTLHYEGEDLGADGKGWVGLNQQVNLNLTGGPISKLAGMGSVGNWIKNASDSLLYYHVSGTFSDLKIETKRGDGQPIVEGAKNITQKSIHAIGTGLDKTGSFIHGLFNHNKDNQNQN